MSGSAALKPKSLTLEEYLAYDDGTDNRYELVDGELVEMLPESTENCDVAKLLFVELLKVVPVLLLSYKDFEIEVSKRELTHGSSVTASAIASGVNLEGLRA